MLRAEDTPNALRDSSARSSKDEGVERWYVQALGAHAVRRQDDAALTRHRLQDATLDSPHIQPNRVAWNGRARVRRRAEDRLEVFEVLTAVAEEEDAPTSRPATPHLATDEFVTPPVFCQPVDLVCKVTI